MEGDLGWHYGGDGSNNWNLDAIVRLGSGGRDALAPPPPLGDDPFFELMMQQQQDVLPHADEWQQQAMNMPAMADPAAAGLDDFLSQAFAAPQLPQAQPSPPRNEAPPPPQQEPPAVDRADPSRGGGSSQPRRTRNNMEIKTVVTVPVADFASSDVWAWRKYGQKPIKGSAYPRGYYRCSSDKDCPARKQSERCINDPTSLVVTYTGEHSHAFPRVRNALAGTLRHRREASSSRARTEVGGSSQAPPPVSPPAPPRTVSQEFNAEEDDDAIAVKVLIDNAAMGPENAYLFPNPDDVPFHGGGEDNLLLPAPERMAVGASHGTVTGAGGGGEPILNVVMDTLFVSGWETAAGRRGNW